MKRSSKWSILFLCVVLIVVAISIAITSNAAEVSSAPNPLSANTVFNVDYRTGSYLDLQGNLDAGSGSSFAAITNCTFQEVGGITCVNVDSIADQFKYMYQSTNYQTLNNVYTIELYTYLDSALQGTPVEIYWGGDDPTFNTLTWTGSAFRWTGSVNITEPARTLTSGWYHIVVSTSATATTMYVNGTQVATGNASGCGGLWYLYVCHTTNKNNYYVANIAIYNTAASASDVATLYANSSVTAEPTATPTATPTAAPTAVPTATPVASAAPTSVPSSISSNLVFNADYRTESYLDLTGNLIAFKGSTGNNSEITSCDFYVIEEITCVNVDSVQEQFLYMYDSNNYQTLDNIYTLEIYVYMTSTLQGTPVEIYLGGDNTFNSLTWTGSAFRFTGTVNITESARTLTSGWYHIVVSTSATATTMYINGTQVATGNVSDCAGLWYLYVCHTTNKNNYYVANVAIYNVAATASQVTELYNLTQGVDEPVYGDVNGDGNINPLDGTMLARYNAGWAAYVMGTNLVQANCDLNNDGNVNPLDSTILARHNAGWAAYATLPWGVL